MKRFLTVFILLTLSVSINAQVVEKNLRENVAYLASEKLEGRRTGEPGAAAAAAYIEKMFRSYGLKAGVSDAKGKSFRQDFSFTPSVDAGKEKKTFSATNIVGVIEGKDPLLKSEAIVIGAHYDHLGRGGQGSLAANSTEVHHGADDNASGTSALLELARHYSKIKNNKRTLIFIAFSGEEEGLFGSKHWVNDPTFPLASVVAMFNMDMVGRLKDGNLTVGGIGSSVEWKSLVEGKNAVAASTAIAGAASRFNIRLDEAGVGPSDHASFYLKQIPVLFFFTGTHTDYHKPSDTFDKINYEGLGKVANFAIDLVSSVDSNAKRPTYKVAPTTGQEAGRRSFAVSIGVMPGYGDEGDGMLVDGVTDGRPAAVAGIKGGDKIVEFAGKPVKNVQDYMAVLGTLQADVEYDIVIVRAGKKLALKVKPAKR